jgi:hypothetical protein
MLLLIIPEYYTAELRFIENVLQGFMDKDPFLSGIERTTTIHKGPIRNVRSDTPLDQRMFEVHGESEISWDSVLNGKIEDYTKFLYDISESQRKSLTKNMFKNISEITDATGQSVNAKGQPLSIDLYLDLLEKIEFGFDDKGNPQYPTMYMPQNAIEKFHSLKYTPEQEQRKKKITEEKRARFNANKRSRRLS